MTLAVRGGPPYHDFMPRVKYFKPQYLRFRASDDDSDRILWSLTQTRLALMEALMKFNSSGDADPPDGIVTGGDTENSCLSGGGLEKSIDATSMST